MWAPMYDALNFRNSFLNQYFETDVEIRYKGFEILK